MREIKLFMAYAPEDTEYKEELSKHLSALKEDGHIAEWSAIELLPGADQMAVLRKKMSQSDIIALLLSADFLGSDHGKDLEEMAFAQKAKKGTVLVPIKIRAVPLSDSYAQFSMLPDQSRPVDDPSWGSRDMAYANIAEGLKRLAVAMQNEDDNTGNVVKPPKKPVSPTPPSPSSPGKPVNTKLIIGIVGAIVLALAIWLVPPMLKDEDKIAYDQAKIENTIDAYNEYIEKFPQGKYVTEAKRFADDLVKEEAIAADNRAWAEAQEVDDITAYKIYLRSYPEGANIAAAEKRISELSTAAEDNDAYNIAKASNNVTNLFHYIENYPSGRHVEEAKTDIKALLTSDGWAYYGKSNSSGVMDNQRYFDQSFGDKDAKPKVGDIIKSTRAITIRRGPSSNHSSKGTISQGKLAEIIKVDQVSANAYYVEIEY